MSAQFFTNEAVSLEKQIDNSIKLTETNIEDIDYVYEIDRCIDWILKNKFEKICLQFPDFLLSDSTEVATCLESRTGQSIYVISDTTYESCCIDYVTAEHVNADALIHYGPVCFSKASDIIPCLRIYEKKNLNIQQLTETLSEEFRQANKENFIIVLDTPYIVHLDLLCAIFKNFNELIGVSTIDDNSLKLDTANVIFVGQNNRKILNIKLSFKPLQLFYYDPEASPPKLVNYEQDVKLLKRRYFLVEKIKDCKTIGIVIGTVAVKNYLRVITRIKKLVSASAKKYYLISVGKPTIAKLANFPEIDVYVIITCAMNEIYENREFYKPIVTPYDIELALNSNANQSNFAYDFNTYLPEADITESELEIVKRSNNVSDVSLITGKLRLNQNNEEMEMTSSENKVALKTDGTVALNTNFGAGFLLEKSWKGLEQNLGQNKPELVTEGRCGLAQGYENEKS